MKSMACRDRLSASRDLSCSQGLGVELAALDEGIELDEYLEFYVWLSEQQADG